MSHFSRTHGFLTHLGTTPSGKKVYLEKLPHEYPRFSKDDHLYAAVLHGANRTRGGAVADLHRLSAGDRDRSKRSHATMKSGAPRKQKDRTHLLRDYVITSPLGKRTWQAEDAAHAREQHLDAFPDDPDERILSVRLALSKRR